MASRWWSFTYFFYVSEDIDFLLECVAFRGIIFQEEMCPKTNQPHLQGTLRLFEPRKMKHVKRLFGEARSHVHLEITRSPEHSVEYCRKGETRFGEVYEEGNLECSQGKRNDLLAIKEDLMEGVNMRAIVRTHFSQYVRYHNGITKAKFLLDMDFTSDYRQMEVVVLYGLTGVRKTGAICQLLKPYRLTREKTYGNVWFDGYDDHDTLLIDDFYGWMPHEQLLDILEGHQCRLAYKGGHTWAKYKRVVITSNKSPHDWYPQYSPAGCRPELARRLLRVLELCTPQDAYNIMPTVTGYGPLWEPVTWREIVGVDYNAKPIINL